MLSLALAMVLVGQSPAAPARPSNPTRSVTSRAHPTDLSPERRRELKATSERRKQIRRRIQAAAARSGRNSLDQDFSYPSTYEGMSIASSGFGVLQNFVPIEAGSSSSFL